MWMGGITMCFYEAINGIRESINYIKPFVWLIKEKATVLKVICKTGVIDKGKIIFKVLVMKKSNLDSLKIFIHDILPSAKEEANSLDVDTILSEKIDALIHDKTKGLDLSMAQPVYNIETLDIKANNTEKAKNMEDILKSIIDDENLILHINKVNYAIIETKESIKKSELNTISRVLDMPKERIDVVTKHSNK